MGRLAATIPLGEHRLVDPVVELTPTVPLLGTVVLSRFRWTFDPAGGRVRVEKAGDGPVVVESQYGIGARLFPVEDGWAVGDVDPGSPAELAGLRPGERVHSIDGVALEWRLQPSLSERLRAPDAKVVFGIRDGDRIRTVEVRTVVLVP